jgi:hypothetical protein
MDKTQQSRRTFLIGAKTAPQPAGTSTKEGGKRAGYKLTEHIRNYYRTTLV